MNTARGWLRDDKRRHRHFLRLQNQKVALAYERSQPPPSTARQMLDTQVILLVSLSGCSIFRKSNNIRTVERANSSIFVPTRVGRIRLEMWKRSLAASPAQ
jgi:hypothetical protein